MNKLIKVLRHDKSLILKTQGTEIDVKNWATVFITDRINHSGDTVEIICRKEEV